mmetsp:Transcript_150226/g.418549  ORF Transcript_150226/g.418549 Transcript_150226/m.418549 type:complete len:272 (-) Transcript_150226:97-912(-)
MPLLLQPLGGARVNVKAAVGIQGIVLEGFGEAASHPGPSTHIHARVRIEDLAPNMGIRGVAALPLLLLLLLLLLFTATREGLCEALPHVDPSINIQGIDTHCQLFLFSATFEDLREAAAHLAPCDDVQKTGPLLGPLVFVFFLDTTSEGPDEATAHLDPAAVRALRDRALVRRGLAVRGAAAAAGVHSALSLRLGGLRSGGGLTALGGAGPSRATALGQPRHGSWRRRGGRDGSVALLVPGDRGGHDGQDQRADLEPVDSILLGRFSALHT